MVLVLFLVKKISKFYSNPSKTPKTSDFHKLQIQQHGLVNVIVESDAQIVVSVIKSSTALNSSVGIVLNDGHSLLGNLEGCSLVHVQRSANQAAHYLARSFVSRSDIREWSESPPSFLTNVLANNLN